MSSVYAARRVRQALVMLLVAPCVFFVVRAAMELWVGPDPNRFFGALFMMSVAALVTALAATKIAARVELQPSSIKYRTIFGTWQSAANEITSVEWCWTRGQKSLKVRAGERFLSFSTMSFSDDDLDSINRAVLMMMGTIRAHRVE